MNFPFFAFTKIIVRKLLEFLVLMHRIGLDQKQFITPKRLNSPYLFRTMLGFFSRRSRPIRSTENYFAQIWNQRIQGKNL